MDSRDRSPGDLVVAGGCDEIDSGAAQRTLARNDVRLLTDEAGHSGNHEQEKGR